VLIDLRAEQIVRTFGLTGVTYFPRPADGHLHVETARFLASVGLPSNKWFSPKLDLDDAARLECRPSLKAAFDAEGAVLPPEAEHWEVLGEFLYATVALDPRTGKIYSFAEGEEFYVPMHEDVYSLVHALTIVDTGLTELKMLPHDDDQARKDAVEHLRERLAGTDPTPFAGEDGEWSRFFEEIGFGMWG
jgi:hypothetical protein